MKLMTASVIGEGEKLITTVLLNGERLHVRIHVSGTGQDLFDHIVSHIGIREVTYFGLMIIKDGEHQFLDLEERLSKLAKYAPHLWKDDSSCNSSLVFTVFFRVKYYVENICLLQEQATRHQYYLQLRKDVLENNIRIHDDIAMVLASYALQAELGDHNRTVHGVEYFVPQHYLPPKTISKLTVPYIKSALPAMHQSHRSLSEAQAEIEFLKEAQKLSEYGVLFHRVFKKEYNRKVPYSLGICVRGLIIYEDTGLVRNPICKHPWNKIGKMSFKRRKFLVNAESMSPTNAHIVLYTANYKRSRYLLRMCSSFFNFQMMMSVRLSKFQDMPDAAPQQTIPTVRIECHNNNQNALGPSQAGSRRASIAGREEHNSVAVTDPRSKPKPEAKQYVVDLGKENGSFGFSIVGGIEIGGIFVKDLTRNGSAAHCKKISPGDRIVQVNKVSFENVTRREASQTLRSAPDKSKFTMETFGQNSIIEAHPSMLTPLTLSASSLATGGMATPAHFASLDKDADLIHVDLAKKDGSFGIGFTGGPELGGIYVRNMLPRGAAEMNGRIAIGDRLVDVNGHNVDHFTRKQVLELLKVSPPIVPLVLERYQQHLQADQERIIDVDQVLRSNQNFIATVLNKNHEGLGFNVTGGLDLGGIFIKSLSVNGPAAHDGRIEVGDRIVAVGNTSLETSTRQRAVEVIRTAPSPVALILEKCVPMSTAQSYQPDSLFRSDSIRSLPTQAGGPPQHVDRLGRPLSTRNFAHSMQDLPRTGSAFSYYPPEPVADNYAANPYSSDVQDGVNNFVSQLFPSHARQMSDANQQIISHPFINQEVFVVDLARQNGGFGLSLTGGPELGGIFVKAIQPGGAADSDGRILRGDRVMEINGRRMDRLSRREASDWLKSSNTVATLVLERLFSQQPFPPLASVDGEFVALELHRANGSFGLSLTGGPEVRGLFIKGLLPGSATERDGRIEAGDRLVEINGVNLDGFTRLQTIELLKNSPSSISIVAEKMRYPDDMAGIIDADLYCVELLRGSNGFGLSLTGGVNLGGVYVKGILPGSEADLDGRVLTGDRVVEINGVSLDLLSKLQAIDLMRQSARQVNLLLERFATFDNMIVPESDFFSVELRKKSGGYGLGLTGGPELSGIYIKSVQPGGAANDDGRIQRGDRIVSVNSVNFEEVTRQQASDVLKGIDDFAVLLIERCVLGNDVPPLDTVLTVVDLSKGVNGFGFSLMGGPDLGGIYVKSILSGGVAQMDKRIQTGDRMVEINGLSVEGMPRLQVTELLKSAPQRTTFIFERIKSKSETTIGPGGAFTPVRSNTNAHASVSAMTDVAQADTRQPKTAGSLLPGSGLAGMPPHRLSTQSAPGNFFLTQAQQQQQKSPVLSDSRSPNTRSPQSIAPYDDDAASVFSSRVASQRTSPVDGRQSGATTPACAPSSTQNGSATQLTSAPFRLQRSNSLKDQKQPSANNRGPVVTSQPGGLPNAPIAGSSPGAMRSQSFKGSTESQATLVVGSRDSGSRDSGFRALHHDMQRVNSAMSSSSQQLLTNRAPSHPSPGTSTPSRRVPQGLQPVNGGSSSGPIPGKTSPRPVPGKIYATPEEKNLIEVVLYKGASGLGISLAAGNEGSIVFNRIAPGSSADECGQLQAGDVLLKVNGTSVVGLSSKEATAMLRSYPHEVQLLVDRPPYRHPTPRHSTPSLGL